MLQMHFHTVRLAYSAEINASETFRHQSTLLFVFGALSLSLPLPGAKLLSDRRRRQPSVTEIAASTHPTSQTFQVRRTPRPSARTRVWTDKPSFRTSRRSSCCQVGVEAGTQCNGKDRAPRHQEGKPAWDSRPARQACARILCYSRKRTGTYFIQVRANLDLSSPHNSRDCSDTCFPQAMPPASPYAWRYIRLINAQSSHWGHPGFGSGSGSVGVLLRDALNIVRVFEPFGCGRTRGSIGVPQPKKVLVSRETTRSSLRLPGP